MSKSSPEELPKETPVVSSVQTAKPAKQRRVWPIVTAILVAIVAIPIGLTMTYVLLIDSQTKEQAKIAQMFVRDLQQGKVDDAYTMTTNAFKNNTDKTEFSKQAALVVNSISTAEPVVNVRRIKTNLGVTTAYVGLNIGEGSTGDHAVVMFRKDDGEWKVHGVQFKSGIVDKSAANNEINNLAANATQ